MIIGYIRVSTGKQDTENQHFEITKFAELNNLQIDGPCLKHYQKATQLFAPKSLVLAAAFMM